MISSAYLNGKEQIYIKNIEIPSCPIGFALIKVFYVGICGSDLLQYNSFRKQDKYPIGHEFSGTIAKINDSSTVFKVGDNVVVSAVSSCGDCIFCKSKKQNICINRFFLPTIGPGGFSEIAIVSTNSLYKLPKSISFKNAALIEPYSVALHALKKGDNGKVLVIGSGTIGLSVIELAKLSRCSELSIVCRYEFQKLLAEELNIITFNENSDIPFHFYDTVINTVTGSKGMELAIKCCKNNGKIVICGGFSFPELYKFREVVSRELIIEGSICYTKNEFNQVIEYMKNEKIYPEKLITHLYDFQNISKAFLVANNKKKYESIKVLIKMNNQK